MNTYFLACSYPLKAGSVILPGNWGRIVRKYTTKGFGNAWILFREEVFERIRQQEYPEKPSRYNAIFLCESDADLAQFLQTTKRSLDLAYEVELLDENLPLHRGCLSFLDFAGQETLASFERKARQYWSAEQVIRPEIVAASPIRVLNGGE